ncbi:MAG: carbon storage regulator CsrA [Halanaerobium sp.]|nr:carbon storage regulator CsrA [Halanaerobium sp.]
MLVLTRKKDEKIIIGNDIVITVLNIEGGQVSLGISAPEDVAIYRDEIYAEIMAENKEAAGRKIDLGQLSELGKQGEKADG